MTLESQQQYQWNSDFGKPEDLPGVVAELRAIQGKNGEIKPELVVEAAKVKTSALHKYFTWDNKEAAVKYRLQEASNLLRRIEVVVIKDGEPKTLRAFEVVSRNETTSNYAPVDTAEQSIIAKNIVINDLKRSINRLSTFPEYQKIVWLLTTALESLSKESTETHKKEMASIAEAV